MGPGTPAGSSKNMNMEAVMQRAQWNNDAERYVLSKQKGHMPYDYCCEMSSFKYRL